jgi:hypothetical protein
MREVSVCEEGKERGKNGERAGEGGGQDGEGVSLELACPAAAHKTFPYSIRAGGAAE